MCHTKLFFRVVSLILFFGSIKAFGAVSADVQASRTSCISPCTIVFSAENTVDSRRDEHEVFQDLGFYFNFDDRGAGVWKISGRSKEFQAGGPIAAHTFECASGQCVHNVSVRARNPEGEYSDATVTVKVDSADTFFSNPSSDTICVSTSGSFSGDVPCPSGAARRTTVPSPEDYSGKRVLLRRGESFGEICVDYRSENVLIEPFGNNSSSRPVVSSVNVGVNGSCNDKVPSDSDLSGYPSQWAKNITITGIRTPSVEYGMSYTHVGLHDVDMNYSRSASGGYLSLSDNTSACLEASNLTCSRIPYPVGAYVSETQIWSSMAETTAAAGNVVTIGAFRCPVINWLAIVGSDVKYSLEHNIRTEGSWRGFWGHNALRGHHLGGKGGKNALTIRACGYGNIDPGKVIMRHNADQSTGDSPMSRYHVVADNRFGSTDNVGHTWLLAIAPTNERSAETLWDALSERNVFIGNPLNPINADAIYGGKYLAHRESNVYSEVNHQICRNRAQGEIPNGYYDEADCGAPVPPTPDAPIAISPPVPITDLEVNIGTN